MDADRNYTESEVLKMIDWGNLQQGHSFVEGGLDFARFASYAKSAEQAGNLKMRDLLYFISEIASLVFHPEAKEQPYQQFRIVMFWGGREEVHPWPSINDLPLEMLLFLGENLDSIEIPDLRARIADLIYIKTREIQWANLAIENFSASIEELKKNYREPLIIGRYTRILMIALEIQETQKINDIKAQIKDYIQKFKPRQKRTENLIKLMKTSSFS